ncbi:MAG: response regulator [Planctomycetes bacterium]|nr:response regulator [Planctomycetota bacterium]
METTPSIFMVDDNPGDIALVHLALEDAGIRANLRNAHDGGIAIAQLGALAADSLQRLPNLILVDLNMPKVTGWEVLAYLRGHEILSRVPSFVLSTSQSPRDLARCQELGFSCWSKPSRFEDYATLIKYMRPFLSPTTAG